MAKTAVIVANGEIPNVEKIKARLRQLVDAFVIAVDGGVRNSRTLNLDVDVVLGDLDSLEPDALDLLKSDGVHIENFPSRKNETDLELGLYYAIDQGAQAIIVLGALGGRLDMTIANALLLTHPRLAGVRVQFWHNDQTAWLIRPPGDVIMGQPGDTVSLIPMGGSAKGVTTHNLAYALNGEELATGPARGVSNVIAQPSARIEVHEGMLLVIHTPGRA